MHTHQTGTEISRMIQFLAKLPGLGPRSARRAALHLIKNRTTLLDPFLQVLKEAQEKIDLCKDCGNVDTLSPCSICQDHKRDPHILCVVEEVGDLWALERAGAMRGYYHVLGGCLSVIDGMRPEDLRIPQLFERISKGSVREVVLALNATVEGQTTAHYLADCLKPLDIAVSHLAQGVPIGGELDYLDDGTLVAAMRARHSL